MIQLWLEYFSIPLFHRINKLFKDKIIWTRLHLQPKTHRLILLAHFQPSCPLSAIKKHIKYQPRQYLMLFSEAHVAQRNDMFTTNNSYSTYIMLKNHVNLLKNHVNYALIKASIYNEG